MLRSKKCPFPKHAQIKRVVKVVMTYGIAWPQELAVRPLCATNRSIDLDSEIYASEQQQKKDLSLASLTTPVRCEFPSPSNGKVRR